MTGARAVGRLALRDIVRRPWRAVLIAALIAVPVAAAVFVSIWMRTTTDTVEEAVARTFGGADLIIDPANAAAGQAIATHPGWQVVELRRGEALVAASGETRRQRRIALIDVDAANPMITPVVGGLSAGRWPQDPGEIAVPAAVATALGVSVGSSVRFVRPAGTFEVVGIGTHSLSETVVRGVLRPSAEPTFFVRTERPMSTADNQLAAGGFVQRRTDAVQRARAETGRVDTSYLYLLGTLGLAAFGLIVAAALAIGSRRQMREIGVMGATGASPGQSARRVRLYALTLGIGGAVVGIVGGLIAAVGGRGFIESRTGSAAGSLEVSATDLTFIGAVAVLVAVAASIAPARIARASVLQALAGHRPVRPFGVHVPVAGVLVFVAGCIATAVSTRMDYRVRDYALIVSVAITVTGMVICSPYVVGRLEGVARATRGSLRLAMRGLARHRPRTGPLVGAIMAAGTLAIGASAYALALSHDTRETQDVAPPIGLVQVAITSTPVARPDVSTSGNCAETTAFVTRAIAPVLNDPAVTCLTIGVATTKNGAERVALVDPASLEQFGAPGRALGAALASGAIINLYSDGIPRSLAPFRSSIIPMPQAAASILQTGLIDEHFVASRTSPAVSALGSVERRTVGLAVQATRLSRDQVDRVNAVQQSDPGADLSTATTDVYVNVAPTFSVYPDDYGRVVYAVILPVALLLALLTTAIGLSLLSSEDRDERVALVALGSGPGLRRAQNGWQAITLTVLGMVLALPGGLALPYVVMRATHSGLGFVVPWAVIATLVVGAPLIAGVGAWLLTRSNLDAVPRRA